MLYVVGWLFVDSLTDNDSCLGFVAIENCRELDTGKRGCAVLVQYARLKLTEYRIPLITDGTISSQRTAERQLN